MTRRRHCPLVLLLATATVNGCGGDDDGRFQIGRVATAELYANGILVAADGTIAVSSGSLSIGEEGSRAELRVINTGASDLEISGVTLESEPPGVFRLARDSTSLAPLSPGPYTIAPQDVPGGQLLLTAYVVVMRPARGVEPVGTLKIASNSFTGRVAQPTITYHLRLDIAPPSILVVPTAIDFGTVLPGQSAQDSVSVLNQGGDALVIDRLWLRGHDGFEVAVGPDTFPVSPESSADGIALDPPLEIAPGATAPLRLQYSASGLDRAIGKLVLSSNDPAAVDGTSVSLLANAGAPTAPVVAIDAPEGANGTITCKLVTEAVHSEPLTYAWYWQVGDATSFTTFGPTLGADEVEDCDRVRCWTEVTDSHVTVSSNVAETVLPVGADCDDENPCTDEACGATGGCLHASNTAPCDDSDLCTGGDMCAEGQCQAGLPVDCAGLTAACIQPTCNPATGQCDLPEPDETPCDDGDLCNGAGACLAGECIAGAATDCSTVTNPCVAKICNPATGACDLAKADDTSCSDGNPCNGVEACHSGVCQPGAAVDCSAQTNPCIQKTCNPDTGACDLLMPDNTPCPDADLCDGAETCHAGVCTPGQATDCSTVANPCVEHACNPASGACDLAKPNDTPCADEDPCNGDEKCDSGICQPGNAIEADGRPCEMEDLCSTASVCSGGACTSSAWVACVQDPDQCLLSYCDPATGRCRSSVLNSGTLSLVGGMQFGHHAPSGNGLDFLGHELTAPSQVQTILHRISYDGQREQTSVFLNLFRIQGVVEVGGKLLLVGFAMPGGLRQEWYSYLLDESWQIVASNILVPLAAPAEEYDIHDVVKMQNGFLGIGGDAAGNGWLVWLNPSGAKVRELVVTESGNDLIGAVEEPAGSLLLLGMLPGIGEIWLGYLQADGAFLWSKRLPFTGASQSLVAGLRPISTTQSIVLGTSVSQVSPTGTRASYRPFVVVVDDDGNLLARHTYGTEGVNDSLDHFVMPLSDGGWLLGGSRRTYNTGSRNWGFVLRARPDGSVLWEKEFLDFEFLPNHAAPYRPSSFLLSGARYESDWSPGWIIIDENGDLCGSP